MSGEAHFTPFMATMMTAHAITAVAYFLITYQLLSFSHSSKVTEMTGTLRDSKDASKRHLYYMLLAVSGLFDFFIILCGAAHALVAISYFFPSQELQYVLLVLMSLCAVVSISTALVAAKAFPVILENLKGFELNGDGQLQHIQNYMIEVVELVKEGVLILSQNMKILRCNEASKEMLRHPQLVGSTYIDFIHPSDRNAFQNTTKQVLSGYSMTPVTIEYRVNQKIHGSERELPTVQKSTAGSGRGFFGGHFSAPSSLKVYAAPHSDRCETALVLSGASAREVELSNHLTEEASSTAKATALIDECYIWVEATICKGMSLNRSNDFEYDLKLVCRNIEDRKREALREYNDLVKENEERARSNAAKLRYISCIAHDLKTPLQSFCFTLDLLNQTNLQPEQREYVQQSNVAVDLMRLTISQTMDISKALTGAKLLPRRTTVYLSSILHRVEVIINGYGKEVPVTFRVASNICDRIITDEEWLWQMILNLLTNACKYTSRGEIKVNVSLTRGTSGSNSDVSKDDMILVEVVDTGVGVSNDKIESMFNAFAQLQEGQVTGTGLGLFGVRTRAEGLLGACGARHNTESSTGTGTVLWFAIPYTADELSSCSRVMSTDDGATIQVTRSYSDSPDATARSCGIADYARNNANEHHRKHSLVKVSTPTDLGIQPALCLSSRKLTALVIDDTKTVCKLMERLLLKMGFVSVKCYENGSKGLEAMMAAPVDIVFSDVQMPIMTGPEMVRRFRNFEAAALIDKTRSMRQLVIAVTANGAELGDDAISGFDEVCPKPLSMQQIHQLVEKYFPE